MSTQTEVRELFSTVRVSRGPDRYRVVRTETGEVVGHGTRSKLMAEREARGRNLMAAQSGWCASMRYESEMAPSILCGATVPAYGVCAKAHQHINREDA